MDGKPTIEDLILAGAIEIAAVDSDTGEFLYQFTPKLKEILPQIWNAHISHVHNEIMYFWERGFVNIEDLTDANPIIRLTELAFDPDAIAALPEDVQQSLKEIKRILKVV